MSRIFLKQHVRRFFKLTHREFVTSSRMVSASALNSMDVLSNSDPEQVRLMAERVILVDKNDNAVGSMSKKDSHLQSNDLPLHRAFSVFLFDSQGRMLLQQRAAEKITFPSFWTNTVCSHPLSIPSETGELDSGDPVVGTKNAAIRKLSHELGVIPGDVNQEDLKFMTRILYRAPCSDGIWGEHELDYVFIVQKDIPLNPEPNEVCDVKYVTKEELEGMFRDSAATSTNLLLTPWFQHIVNSFAWRWWDTILDEGLQEVSALQDSKIHVMS